MNSLATKLGLCMNTIMDLVRNLICPYLEAFSHELLCMQSTQTSTDTSERARHYTQTQKTYVEQ